LVTGTRLKEALMKKLKYFCSAVLVFALMAIPAVAQHGKKGTRHNNGAGEPRGQARAEEVQAENKKGDKDPSKGNKGKPKREGWEKKAKHKAKGHS